MTKFFIFLFSAILSLSMASCKKDKKDLMDYLPFLLANSCPGVGSNSCTSEDPGTGSHKMVFINCSGETIYLGLWNNGAGVDPPSCWSEWKLEKGEVKTWIAPKGSSGRIWPRTGCTSGTCDAGDCGGIRCTVTGQPTSLVEFTLDSGDDTNWYDVSYVDGYNFPITITTDHSSCKKSTGCNKLPTCPWDERSGVCFSSCQEFSRRYPTDYTTRDEFYKVCCKCKTPADQCGCGDQCSGSLSPCTAGWGCSIYANYNDPLDNLALDQCCCSPLRADQETSGINTCRADGAWPTDYDGIDYTAYPQRIKDVCAASYTWQYHDEEGLITCKNDGNPQDFVITFHPRP